MKTSDRELDERTGRLLRAGNPAYPANMDRRLRERLARIGAGERSLPLRSGFRRWTLAVSAVAVVLIVAAGMIWRSSARPTAPFMNETPVRTRPTTAVELHPPPLPTPSVVQAARIAPPPTSGRGRRAVKDRRNRSEVQKTVRMEFTIPDQEITILWEQQGDFDLAALVAAD